MELKLGGRGFESWAFLKPVGLVECFGVLWGASGGLDVGRFQDDGTVHHGRRFGWFEALSEVEWVWAVELNG